MGRAVYDHKGEFIWKYVFGKQDSEQYRITQDLAIGKYSDRNGNVSPSRKYGDLLMLSRKDIEKLAYTIKPLRRQIASLMRAERKCFGTKGMASFKDVDILYAEARAKNPDIIFHTMCHRFVKKGRLFFKNNPKSKVMNCYGEM